jgi:hypothetical protein
MTNKEILIKALATIIGGVIVTSFIAWAFVSAFSFTWGQSLLLSWMFYLLRDAIRYPE